MAIQYRKTIPENYSSIHTNFGYHQGSNSVIGAATCQITIFAIRFTDSILAMITAITRLQKAQTE